MSFTYKESVIAARELTIGDDLDIATIVRTLIGTDDSKWLVIHTNFATYQLGAEVTGSEPITRITASSEPSAILTAFNQWKQLPRSFSGKWAKELASVEQGAKN